MKNGIYVPLITPFLENEEVDYRGLEKATEFVLSKGAEGIYAVGSSAECFLLTHEERKKCLEVIVGAAGGAPVIAHVGALGTKKAVDLALHAEKVGAARIASVPPFYHPFSVAETKRYFEDLAESVSLPLMIYTLSLARDLSLEELRSLAENPKITSIKFTNTNYYLLEQLKTETGIEIFSGKDECFLSALAAGADGAIGSTFNYWADRYIRIREWFEKGDHKRALRIQAACNAVTSLLMAGGNLAVVKYIMRLQGLDIRPDARRPFSALSPEQKREIERVYAEHCDVD